MVKMDIPFIGKSLTVYKLICENRLAVGERAARITGVAKIQQK
jgi:hypothetical protein